MVAFAVGLRSLPLFAHKYSPKKFTQPQLFACLVLKEFLQFDYRKLAATLADSPSWTEAIGLRTIPHFTTLQKAARRLLRSADAQRLLDTTVKEAQERSRMTKRVRLAAMDGSGWESRHASAYYVRRCAKGGKAKQKLTYQRFPKAGLSCDTATHFILGIVPGRGPGPDILHYRCLLEQSLARTRIDTLAADAGYDAEHSHRFAREKHGVRTLIPPLIGRPTDKKPTGYWRRQMAERLHLTRYTQRWQSETVNSMLKRLLGSALRARTYWSQCRELCLRAVTHNILILRWVKVFYGAGLSPLPRLSTSSPRSTRIVLRFAPSSASRPQSR
jgi:hypothetical protein